MNPHSPCLIPPSMVYTSRLGDGLASAPQVCLTKARERQAVGQPAAIGEEEGDSVPQRLGTRALHLCPAN